MITECMLFTAETVPMQTAAVTVNESLLPMDTENSCLFTVLITGGASAFGSAVIVLCISVVIHITVYQCVYKPRLRSRAMLEGVCQKDYSSTAHCGHEYAAIYEVIGERVNNSELEMKHNEVYGLAEPTEK